MNRLLSRTLLAASLLGAFAGAQAQSFANGGFESGDFAGWTLAGNTAFTGVQCTGPGASVKAGNCAAFFGAEATPATLSQTFSTSTGGAYTLSFAALFDGATPSSFSAAVNGVTLFSAANAYSAVYQTIVVPFVATGSTATLTFSVSNDQGLSFLDAVSVSAVPEPASALLLLAGLGAVVRTRRSRAYTAAPCWSPSSAG